MAYNKESLTKLAALESLASRMKGELGKTNQRVTALENTVQSGGDLAAAIAAAGHLKRKKVASVSAIDCSADDAEQCVYLVPKSNPQEGDGYDEYMVIDGEPERLGDWSVDLSGYMEKQEDAGLYPDADKNKLAGISEGATRVTASETPGAIMLDGAKLQIVDIASSNEVEDMLNLVFTEAENGAG